MKTRQKKQSTCTGLSCLVQLAGWPSSWRSDDDKSSLPQSHKWSVCRLPHSCNQCTGLVGFGFSRVAFKRSITKCVKSPHSAKLDRALLL